MYFLFFLTLLLPIAVHLWGLRVKKRVFLGGIEPLLNSSIDAGGTDKLRKLLLLVSRILFLLALIFAFLFFRIGNSLKDRSHIKQFNFVDNSGSMCALNGGKFSTFIQNANSQEKVLPQCSMVSTSINDFFEQNTSNKQKNIFSDFQKTFINGSVVEHSENWNLVAIENETGRSNVSIDSIWLSDNFIKYNSPMILNVLLRNNGDKQNDNLLVELKIGDKSVASNLEKIAPFAVKRVQFPIVLKNQNDRKCEIKLDDASWTFDNNFYFSLNPIEQLDILLVGDVLNSNPIKIAFDQESIFNCKSIRTIGDGMDGLSKTSLMVVNQANGLKENEVKLLTDFVKSGGTAVVIPSEEWKKADSDFINGTLGGLATEIDTKDQIELENPDINSPFFRGVFDKAISANMPFVKPILKIRNISETILKTKAGETALAGLNLGKGKVYLFSFGLGKNETFSSNALFLPIFYRIAESSAKNRLNSFFRITDEVVEFVPKDHSEEEEVYSLENGDFKIVPEQRIQGEKVRLFLPKQEIPLGIWHVKNKNGLEVVQFGLNTEKAESVSDFYSVEKLKEKFKNDAKVKVMSFEEFQEDVKEKKTIDGHWPFWRFAIVISFLFLLAETLIARYYKRKPLSV